MIVVRLNQPANLSSPDLLFLNTYLCLIKVIDWKVKCASGLKPVVNISFFFFSQNPNMHENATVLLGRYINTRYTRPVAILNLETKAHHSTFNSNKEKKCAFQLWCLHAWTNKVLISAKAHTWCSRFELSYCTSIRFCNLCKHSSWNREWSIVIPVGIFIVLWNINHKNMTATIHNVIRKGHVSNPSILHWHDMMLLRVSIYLKRRVEDTRM